MKSNMEYKVLSERTPDRLTTIVNQHITNGWKPIGGHQSITVHEQKRFRGSEHVDTLFEIEYSQTIVKED